MAIHPKMAGRIKAVQDNNRMTVDDEFINVLVKAYHEGRESSLQLKQIDRICPYPHNSFAGKMWERGKKDDQTKG